MNSITITSGMNPTATDRHIVTTEVIEKSHVFLEDTTNDFAAFTEWENVPASLQSEMAECVQEINRATSRLQELIKRAVPEQPTASTGMEEFTQLADC